MKALKIVNLTLLTTLLSLSCSKKQEASHTKADFPVNQAKIPVEVYPFNSLPIDHLLEEAENYFLEMTSYRLLFRLKCWQKARDLTPSD